MRSSLVAIALFGFALANAAPLDSNNEGFADWKKNNNETCGDQLDNLEHHIIFDINKEKIIAFNNQTGAHLVLNDLAGLTPDELKHRYFGISGYDLNNTGNGGIEVTPAHRAAWPASLDWRNKDGRSWVNAVRNQNPCGSCYAFATISAVESRYSILTKGALPDLSEQEIVDCGLGTAWNKRSSVPDATGCDGGWPGGVVQYLMKAGGSQRETFYPYKVGASVGQTCTISKTNPAGRLALKFKGTGFSTPKTEDEVIQALQSGPVVFCMHIDGNQAFMFLSAKDKEYRCPVKSTPYNIQHAMTLVGYTPQYWIIRNSWGTTEWGNGGYMNLPRVGDPCGVLATITVPELTL